MARGRPKGGRVGGLVRRACSPMRRLIDCPIPAATAVLRRADGRAAEALIPWELRLFGLRGPHRIRARLICFRHPRLPLPF